MQPHVPDGSRVSFPEPLTRFVESFNQEEFWESHEVLEEAWRKGRSEFYHGLILYASAFVHVQRGNPRGVVAQLRKAERSLARYAPSYLGIDVASILLNAAALRAPVADAVEKATSDWRRGIVFPRLALEPVHARGDELELTGE